MSSFVNKCNFVLLRRYFDAINKAECETFRKKCIELSQNEEGSQYYGFTVNSDETKFFCREAYNTVADVQKHIDNVGATIGELLGRGHAKITVIYVHATAEQINKTETYRDPDSFADIVRGMHLYGRKILRPEALVNAIYTSGL